MPPKKSPSSSNTKAKAPPKALPKAKAPPKALPKALPKAKASKTAHSNEDSQFMILKVGGSKYYAFGYPTHDGDHMQGGALIRTNGEKSFMSAEELTNNPPHSLWRCENRLVIRYDMKTNTFSLTTPVDGDGRLHGIDLSGDVPVAYAHGVVVSACDQCAKFFQGKTLEKGKHSYPEFDDRIRECHDCALGKVARDANPLDRFTYDVKFATPEDFVFFFDQDIMDGVIDAQTDYIDLPSSPRARYNDDGEIVREGTSARKSAPATGGVKGPRDDSDEDMEM